LELENNIMPEKKIIIGLVGQLACGKGTVAEYLKKKYGASVYRYSTMLRDVLNRLYLEINRVNIQDLSSVLRKKFGEDLLAKVITEDVKKDSNKLIVVDGIRRMDDIKYLINEKGFILTKVTAKPETRYKRITGRGENTDDTKKTFAQFLKDETKEADAGIPKVMTKAKKEINNDGDLDDLHKQVDNLIKELA